MATGGNEQALQAALQHHQAGRLGDAERMYRQILASEPGNAAALHLLGCLAGQMGQLDVAVGLIRQAIEVSPTRALFHNNLAKLLMDGGDFEGAVRSSRRATELERHFPQAYFNLGKALQGLGQIEEAIAAFRESLSLEASPDTFCALGYVLNLTLRHDEALACYHKALALRPDFAEAHYNVGYTLQACRQLDAAATAYEATLRCNPHFSPAYNNLGSIRSEQGELEKAMALFRKAMEGSREAPAAHSNLIHTMLYDPTQSDATIAQELARWEERYMAPLKSGWRPHENPRQPERRLKIGYVSPDFREHAVGRNILPLFQAHDRSQVELFCYSNSPQIDELTGQFRALADEWREIHALSDENAAELIRRDRIDILVDLSLHTMGHRLRLFAMKPAPVQVTFAGYPGSTGLKAVDYRLSDRYLDPWPNGEPGDWEVATRPASGYVERCVRLPHSFWCYGLDDGDVAVGSSPCEARGTITFGCFNSLCKINDKVLALWADILRTVERSRLLLLATEGKHRNRVRQELQKHGIEQDRVEYRTPRPRKEYLALFNEVDIALDTMPYNGHTTTLDTLWMGVPVVTLSGGGGAVAGAGGKGGGATIVGRGALSILKNLGGGVEKWMAADEAGYVSIARELAASTDELRKWRRELRDQMRNSPLMNAENYARGIEAAYRAMWRHGCTAGA